MKRTILFLILTLAVMVGGVEYYQWAFAPSVNAQQAIVSHGWEYKGTATLSQGDYNNLKSDLSLRDSSLQTPTDLVIIGATSIGELVISYDFYSVNNYPNLNRQKPSSGFGEGSSLVPPLFFGVLISLVFLLILRGAAGVSGSKIDKPYENKV
jgi:hypothetical protein